MGNPLFELKISEDDDTGVEAIALVDHPATESNWHAFNKKQKFKTIDKDKRIIAGFAMIAGQKMFRRDSSGEYHVFFSAETIGKIVEKFFRQKRTDQSNIMHNSNLMLDDVFMIESFRIDTERGIVTPKGFDEAPDGSWFVAMKVDDLKLWEEFIKTGEFRGFSVEGIFEQVQVEFNIMGTENIEDIKQVKSTLTKILDFLNIKMGDHEDEQRERPPVEKEEEEEFGKIELQNGDVLTYDGELKIGIPARIISAEGELTAPDGEHEAADGSMIIVTADGMITDIQRKQEEIPVDEDVMADLLAKLEASKQKNKELTTNNKKLKEDFETEATQLDKVTLELSTANTELEEKQKTITKLEKQESQAPAEKPSGQPSWMTVDRNKIL